jgi:4-amino-4-deoxy-L-arabinose transferase-like glycosyltransferase
VWLLIILASVCIRLGAGVWWESRLPADQRFYFGDSDTYWVLGQAIARGDPYQYLSPERSIFRTPGYPLLLAAMFRVLGTEAPVMAARALSALFGGGAVAVLGWWTTRLFGARAGLIAGVLAMLYPGAVAMGAFVLAEAPFCPFMLAQLALWGLASRSGQRNRSLLLAAAAGLAGAIATLIRPSWLLFTPFGLLVGLASKERRHLAPIGAVMLVAFAFGMAPWWIRNAYVSGHFVATTLQTGASLYDGLNPIADGGSNMSFVPEFEARQRAAHPELRPAEFEYQLNRSFDEAAHDWARAHPARVLELAAIKFVRIWNVWPNEPAFRSPLLKLVVLVSYVPILVLSIVGALRFRGGGWPYALPWLPAVYFTLLHIVFVGSIRYREPAVLALMPLAAGVLARVPPHAVQTRAGASVGQVA